MTEIQHILDTIERIHLNAQPAALATLVCVRGSSYRRAGARMVIGANGVWSGAISGGCLEGDVLLKAQQIINRNIPELVTYDTTNDDANFFGVGLGCNGIIDILIEPFDSLEDSCVQALRSIAQPMNTIIHALVYRSNNTTIPVGTRWLINTNKSLPYAIPQQLYTDCITQYNASTSVNRIYSVEQRTIEVLIEVIKPQTQLVICGAGYDAKPIAHMASLLGWHVTVTDKSAVKANRENFPTADMVVCVQPSAIAEHITFNNQTVCIILSHNFVYDTDVLMHIVLTDVRYIGILGPRKRWEKIQVELTKKNIRLNHSILDKIYSPVGLDLSAETPEEIALSIIAEIQNVLHGGTGNSLRTKLGTIHPRADEVKNEPTEN